MELLAGGLGGFRLKSSSSLAWTELRCHSSQESQDWVEKIKEVSTSAVLRDTESRRRERSLRIALELSNLVVRHVQPGEDGAGTLHRDVLLPRDQGGETDVR